MSKLKIYGVAQSRTSRVLWMAHELGLDFEHVPIDFRGGALNTPEFLKLNPNARIPVIQDGDLVLWESLAINLYLARKHGRGLWPATPAGEAQAIQWSLWVATECESQTFIMAQHTNYLPAAERRPEEVASARARLERPFGVLNVTLANRPYLLGDAFSVADLNVAAALNRARQFDLAPHPHFKDWLARCYGRPAWAAIEKLRTS